MTFTPPPPRPPGVFQRSRVGSLLGVSSAHLTVDGTRPIRRNNGERASKRKKPVLRWPGGYAAPPPLMHKIHRLEFQRIDRRSSRGTTFQ